MSQLPASHRDLFEAPGACALATIGADGRPQVTAVWFLVEDGRVRISLNETRQKTRNLLASPEATVFFHDPANIYRTVEVRGTAQVELDDDYRFADRVGTKYGGADLRRMDKPGERRYVVTVNPVRVNSTG